MARATFRANLEEYRNKGYGFRLLKQHFIKNGLLLRNKYVFCDCKTEEGLALIKKFKLRESRTYKVIKVDREKYIILKDDRVKYTIFESDI